MLDLLFWRKRRVCPEVEEQLRHQVDALQAENDRLQHALARPTRDVDRDASADTDEDAEEDDGHDREWDNLTRIWGIGPKVAGTLYLSGVTTFTALATQKPEALERLLARAGKPRYLSQHNAVETWQDQARLAAAGRWAELDALQERLSHNRSHAVTGDDSHEHPGAAR